MVMSAVIVVFETKRCSVFPARGEVSRIILEIQNCVEAFKDFDAEMAARFTC